MSLQVPNPSHPSSVGTVVVVAETAVVDADSDVPELVWVVLARSPFEVETPAAVTAVPGMVVEVDTVKPDQAAGGTFAKAPAESARASVVVVVLVELADNKQTLGHRWRDQRKQEQVEV